MVRPPPGSLPAACRSPSPASAAAVSRGASPAPTDLAIAAGGSGSGDASGDSAAARDLPLEFCLDALLGDAGPGGAPMPRGAPKPTSRRTLLLRLPPGAEAFKGAIPAVVEDAAGRVCLLVLPSDRPADRAEAATAEALLAEVLRDPSTAARRACEWRAATLARSCAGTLAALSAGIRGDGRTPGGGGGGGAAGWRFRRVGGATGALLDSDAGFEAALQAMLQSGSFGEAAGGGRPLLPVMVDSKEAVARAGAAAEAAAAAAASAAGLLTHDDGRGLDGAAAAAAAALAAACAATPKDEGPVGRSVSIARGDGRSPASPSGSPKPLAAARARAPSPVRVGGQSAAGSAPASPARQHAMSGSPSGSSPSGPYTAQGPASPSPLSQQQPQQQQEQHQQEQQQPEHHQPEQQQQQPPPAAAPRGSIDDVCGAQRRVAELYGLCVGSAVAFADLVRQAEVACGERGRALAAAWNAAVEAGDGAARGLRESNRALKARAAELAARSEEMAREFKAVEFLR